MLRRKKIIKRESKKLDLLKKDWKKRRQDLDMNNNNKLLNKNKILPSSKFTSKQ